MYYLGVDGVVAHVHVRLDHGGIHVLLLVRQAGGKPRSRNMIIKGGEGFKPRSRNIIMKGGEGCKPRSRNMIMKGGEGCKPKSRHIYYVS